MSYYENYNSLPEKINKKDAEIIHTKKRALERFDIVLNNEDIKNIRYKIRNNKSNTLGQLSNRVSIHLLNYKNKEMLFLYDQDRNAPITVLYPEWANNLQ